VNDSKKESSNKMSYNYSDYINWEDQWSLHSPYFKEGFVHYPMGKNTLRLKPGPGFGDLSHPTTRLVLGYLKNLKIECSFLDIGCGSGILSLAAASLGVKNVYGIDIDPQAIAHAQLNAKLNHLDIWYGTSEAFIEKFPAGTFLAVMNMIQSEQKLAWHSVEQLHPHILSCVTSGILKEEKRLYQEKWEKEGWTCLSMKEEQGWMAFHFSKV
jgi:ribosomal protein L11 methyltransferase